MVVVVTMNLNLCHWIQGLVHCHRQGHPFIQNYYYLLYFYCTEIFFFIKFQIYVRLIETNINNINLKKYNSTTNAVKHLCRIPIINSYSYRHMFCGKYNCVVKNGLAVNNLRAICMSASVNCSEEYGGQA